MGVGGGGTIMCYKLMLNIIICVVCGRGNDNANTQMTFII